LVTRKRNGWNYKSRQTILNWNLNHIALIWKRKGENDISTSSWFCVKDLSNKKVVEINLSCQGEYSGTEKINFDASIFQRI